MRTANGTLVVLHAHDLTAVNAEAHVAAWQHYSILLGSVADDALALTLVVEIGLVGTISVDVVQVHYLVVVKQFLLDSLVLQLGGAISP